MEQTEEIVKLRAENENLKKIIEALVNQRDRVQAQLDALGMPLNQSDPSLWSVRAPGACI